jgi:putative ABC transport system permease protein
MMLRRKMLRDLARHRGQALALALVFGLGVTAFVGIRGAYVGLAPSTAELYARLELPDVVTTVTFAPERVVAEVGALAGVAVAEGRIALDTTADEHPGVTVRVVSLPAPLQPQLGRVEVVRGAYLSGAAGELVVAEAAASYHGLEPGGTLRLKDARGADVDFEVVGVVRQPEHLTMIPAGGYMGMPRGYAVVFVPEASAMRLLGRSEGVTEVSIRLASGADVVGVERDLRDGLGGYRPSVTAGADVPSVRNVRSHLAMLASAAIVFPLLFLASGALGGFVLLSRLVRRERGLIGLLRASGYGRASIAGHYLGSTILMAGAGAALGVPSALPLSAFVRRIFAADLGMPPSGSAWNVEIALIGAAAAILSGALAGALPAWLASRLAPAEAMRPESPPSAARFRWLRIPSRTAASRRMLLRNLLRRPLRTLLTTVGVSAAVVLALAPTLILAETGAVAARVQAVRQYDLRVVPRVPQPATWLEEARAIPGVTRVEGLLEVPIDLVLDGMTLRTYALGLPDDGRLMSLALPPPGEALMARGLPGGASWVVLRGPVASVELGAAGSIDYPLGRPVVLRMADAHRLLAPPTVLTDLLSALFGVALPGIVEPVTAALVSVDAHARERVRGALAALPAVARVDDREVEREDLARIFGLTRSFIWVIATFGLILGLALLYNSVAVNALERRRELATLRVLGFAGGTVGGLFVAEVSIVALIGFAPGVPLAWWAARAAMADFPDFLPGGVGLDPIVVAAVGLGVAVTVLLATWPAVRELRRLDLAEVVRERE